MLKINVGDLVRIRDFEDMEEEFDMDFEGDLRVGSRHFTQVMRCLSGVQFIAGSINDEGVVEPNEYIPLLKRWSLTEEMLDVMAENVIDLAIRDSSKFRDDLILTSTEDDDFQLKVSSNYGQEINVEMLAKSVLEGFETDIFYFEIEDDYNERETQCIGLSLEKVRRLAEYLTELVEDIEREAVSLILEDIFTDL